ncbi:MAG: O-antigen ligase family protein [Hyphomicrobiaceae bacterium]
MQASLEALRPQSQLGQIAAATAATLLVGMPMLLLPMPFAALAPIVLAVLPLAVIVAFRSPFILCLIFIVFSFFRIHEAFPVLGPLKIPSLVAIPTLIVIAWHIFLSREIKPFWSKELKVFAVFFALVTIGVPFAVSKPAALAYWTATYWKIATMVVAIAWLVRTPRDFGMAARALVVGSSLISIVAISNKLAGIGLVEGTRVTIGREAGSVLGDPNDLSLILMFPLGFAVSLVVTPASGWINKILGAVGVVLMVWAIVCTQSRGGILGILSIMGVVGLRVVKSKVVLISVGVCAALVLFAAMGINKRSSGGAAESGVDESAMGRIYAWGAAWNMAVARPLNGVGLDNFVPNYYFYSSHWDGQNHAVHSTWFNVLAETGFPGIIVFVYMIYTIMRSATVSMFRLAEARAPPPVQAMALALVAGIPGFIAGGTFLTQGFTWPVYILLALTTATARYTALNCPVQDAAVEERKSVI